MSELPEPDLPSCAGQGPDWVSVRLPAEMDISNAPRVYADLIAAADQGTAIVIADMTATNFCDCAGARMLVLAGRHAADRGAELRVAASARALRRMFELAGVNAALRVWPSVAVAALAPPDGGPGLTRRGTVPD